MTYLATEMLLYLLAAAVVGLILGWLIAGGGRRRKMEALHGELTSAFSSEQAKHRETRILLERADDRTSQALEAAKGDADRAIGELRHRVDAERQASQEAYTALERMRTELDEAIQVTESDEAAAAEAVAKEAQWRAELEELRLLIGAEKLAADSARSELKEVRSDMQVALEAEQTAHRQAKTALDDIRSTLTRTFGASAPGPAMTGDGEAENDDSIDRSAATLLGGHAFSKMTDMAVAGEALNNPDLDEADIEDREDVDLDLPATIDEDSSFEMVDSPIDMMETAPPAIPDRIELRPSTVEFQPPAVELGTSPRPTFLLYGRPDQVDDFKVIDGIDPDVEARLYEAGCYRYSQLAAFTSTDVEWLARTIDMPTDRIVADRWVEQARSLQSESGDERPDDARPGTPASGKQAAS